MIDRSRGWGRGTRFVAFFLMVAAMFAVGCGGPATRYDDRPPSPEALSEFISTSWAVADSFEASVRVRVEADGFGGALFGVLHWRADSSFALSLKAPFGISVGDVVVTDGRYEATLGNGRFDTGAVADLDLAMLTGLPLPASDLARLFEPLVRPVGPVPTTLAFTAAAPESLWTWRLADRAAEYEITFDPQVPRVREESWYDPADGHETLHKEYGDGDWRDGVWIAGQLSLEARGTTRARVDVTFDDLELNPAWTTDPFPLRSMPAAPSDPDRD